MNLTLPRLAASLLLVSLSAPALAQSNVSIFSKYAWSENVGWTNWADAGSPLGTQGAVIAGSFASGFVWMENAGWLNLGDGTPTNGTAYANLNGTDFGVNIAPNGALSGFAWAENLGWVNFTLPSLPIAQRPRLDAASFRLRGYAWGENMGWINLDNANSFIGFYCPADIDTDGDADSDDVVLFFAAWDAADLVADIDHDGDTDSDDIIAFFALWDSGC